MPIVAEILAFAIRFNLFPEGFEHSQHVFLKLILRSVVECRNSDVATGGLTCIARNGGRVGNSLKTCFDSFSFEMYRSVAINIILRLPVRCMRNRDSSSCPCSSKVSFFDIKLKRFSQDGLENDQTETFPYVKL